MKPWLGRCNRCGTVEERDRTYIRAYKLRSRRCSCGGYLHGLRGEERQAAQAAFKVGGKDALLAMFAQEDDDAGH